MKKFKKFKNATGAFLLATSPAWANSKTGDGPPQISDEQGPPQGSTSQEARPPGSNGGISKRQINIASIAVDKADKRKVQHCTVPKVNLASPKPQQILSMGFNPKKKQVVLFQFAMADIRATDDERVLVLLYSRCLSKKPKIRTPQSKNQLALDVKDLQILGTYDVPAIQTSPTSITATQMTIEVELETDKLAQQIKAGNDTFYFQAGLLKKNDFENKNYRAMLLSPLEAIHATPKKCPSREQFSKRINAENESCKHLPTKTE